MVSGSLRATDTLYSTTAQFSILRAPTSSGGTTFGVGSNGQILKSNGTSIYWAADNDSHYATHMYVNATAGGATSNANTANTTTYLHLYDNTTKRETVQIKGSGTTSVSSTGGVITINSADSKTGTVTSVQVQATSPVTSSVNTAQTGSLNTTIALADNYGDTKNPYASKTKNYVLAAGATANSVPSFRALVAADIPNLAASKITSGTFDTARIPTLSITDKTSGTLTVARGGTGATNAADARAKLGVTPANIGAVSKAGDTMTGTLIVPVLNPQCVELIPNAGASHGGYVDFHYNGSTADFTSRIIEGASGELTINGINLGANDIHVPGNLYVSSANTTGGGIILADDGDIVDLNDGYCAMRFLYGVRIFSANRGGSAAITLANNGTIGLDSTTYPSIHAQRTDAGETSIYLSNNTAGWAIGLNVWSIGAGGFGIGQYSGTGSSTWRFRIDNSGYCYTSSYLNLGGGNENNASSPAVVWGSNGSDTFLRSYQTTSLTVGSAYGLYLGSGNWWNYGRTGVFHYEGANKNNNKLPIEWAEILRFGDNTRGGAFAIDWRSSAESGLWFNKMHDDNGQGIFSGWQPIAVGTNGVSEIRFKNNPNSFGATFALTLVRPEGNAVVYFMPSGSGYGKIKFVVNGTTQWTIS